jgi:hypothetical protein
MASSSTALSSRRASCATTGILVVQVPFRTRMACGQVRTAGDLDVPCPGEDPAPHRTQGLPLDGLGEGFVLRALHLLQATGVDDSEGGAQGTRGLLGTRDQLMSVNGLAAHNVLQPHR